jgi:hypothetical protein
MRLTAKRHHGSSLKLSVTVGKMWARRGHGRRIDIATPPGLFKAVNRSATRDV